MLIDSLTKLTYVANKYDKMNTISKIKLMYRIYNELHIYFSRTEYSTSNKQPNSKTSRPQRNSEQTLATMSTKK